VGHLHNQRQTHQGPLNAPLTQKTTTSHPYFSFQNPPTRDIHDWYNIYISYVQIGGRDAFSEKKGTGHFDYDDTRLEKIHHAKKLVYMPRHFQSVIPAPETIKLLEACGYQPDHYRADLDPLRPYNLVRCFHEGQRSSYLTLNVVGGKRNPFIRYEATRKTSSETAEKVFDLVGSSILYAENKECGFDSKKFLKLTLSFPDVVSDLLLDPKKREEIKRRCWSAHRRFWKRLPELFDIQENEQLGNSSTFHPHSSECPALPHAHFHDFLPMMVFRKGLSKKDRLSFESSEDVRNAYEKMYSRLYLLKLLRRIIQSRVFGESLTARELLGLLKEERTGRFVLDAMKDETGRWDVILPPYVSHASLRKAWKDLECFVEDIARIAPSEFALYSLERLILGVLEGGKSKISDLLLQDLGGRVLPWRRIVKEEEWQQLVKEWKDPYSNISQRRGFALDRETGSVSYEGWVVRRLGRRFPIVAKDLRRLWTSCVYAEFEDLLGVWDEEKLLDARVDFVDGEDKTKTLHFLRYKGRHPIVDVDEFFRRLPGVVCDPLKKTDYLECGFTAPLESFDDLSKIFGEWCSGGFNDQLFLEYVRGNFTAAVMREDVEGARLWESRLRRFERLFERYGSDAFYDWLRYLVGPYKADTRPLGWWKNISWYRQESLLYEGMSLPSICSLCGGMAFKSSYEEPMLWGVSFDGVVGSVRGGFNLVLCDRPPDPGGGGV